MVNIQRFKIERIETTLLDFVETEFNKFNMPWHRQFSYRPRNMEALIQAILFNADIGKFTTNSTRNHLVKGCQRITTIRLFLEDSFYVKINKKRTYFSQLDTKARKLFCNYKVFIDDLVDVTENDVVQYYSIVSFNGFRSKVHRSRIEDKLKEQVDACIK